MSHCDMQNQENQLLANIVLISQTIVPDLFKEWNQEKVNINILMEEVRNLREMFDLANDRHQMAFEENHVWPNNQSEMVEEKMRIESTLFEHVDKIKEMIRTETKNWENKKWGHIKDMENRSRAFLRTIYYETVAQIRHEFRNNIEQFEQTKKTDQEVWILELIVLRSTRKLASDVENRKVKSIEDNQYSRMVQLKRLREDAKNEMARLNSPKYGPNGSNGLLENIRRQESELMNLSSIAEAKLQKLQFIREQREKKEKKIKSNKKSKTS